VHKRLLVSFKDVRTLSHIDSRTADGLDGEARVPAEDNKDVIRKYIEAVDGNQTNDWSLLDDYIAEDSSPTTLRFPVSAWTAKE
jgi:hypothetical protein